MSDFGSPDEVDRKRAYRQAPCSVKPAPLSAYIHIPFCAHKCDFCDFAVVTKLDDRIPEYCQTVAFEIKERLKASTPTPLSTVFYGGGTPGYIEPQQLAIIHTTLAERAGLDSNAEITLETTPNSITEAKAYAWLSLGINRLSIGVESFHDHELKAMGRDHSLPEAFLGIEQAQKAGFTNIAVDLMYAVPEQTMDSWDSTLDKFLSLNLPHLSAYALTLATNSPLLKPYPIGSSRMPDDDMAASMYELLVARTSKAGLTQYEISNFAKAGYACKHNLTYWLNNEYYAFGVSAHRYVAGIRSHNWRSFNRYMQDPLNNEGQEAIDNPTLISEGIILGLRTTAGINLNEFKERYGMDPSEKFQQKIAEFESQGLMEHSANHLKLTQRGMLLSNLVLSEFI